jgi:membrane glycosyltransferase
VCSSDLLVQQAPALLVFAAPLLFALIAAAPVAHLTASPRLGRLAMAAGFCDMPEERGRPAILAALDDSRGRGSRRRANSAGDRSLAA